MFTINNPVQGETPSLDWNDARYVVYQKEKGAEGTPHFQGYVLFNKPKRLNAVKKLNGRAHWEPRRGTHEQARDYCMKEETRIGAPIELGEPPAQGKRTDVEQLVEMAKDPKMSVADICDELPASYARMYKAVAHIKSLYVPKREWKTEVHWYWGPTGTGKSKTAHEMCDQPYLHNMSNGKWFDGYVGQEDVIFDDMRKDTFKYHELLRLFDRYELKVEIKGGMTQFAPKRIIVTTCEPPETMYDTREDVAQLLRRIDVVRHFPASVNEVLGKGKKRKYPGDYVGGFSPPENPLV